MRCAESLSLGHRTDSDVCNFINICARETSLALEDNSIYPGLGSVPSNQLVALGADEDIFGGLVNGTCQVLADYGAAIVEASARQAGFTDEYFIGSSLVSKEPRVIGFYDKVPEFNSFLNWILISLFAAAREGITQTTAEEFPQTEAFGEKQQYAFINAVKAVGNMDEILARDGIALNNSGIPINDKSAGFIISHPIGPTQSQGQLGSTGIISQVIKRGRLRCAIQTNRPGFAERAEGDNFIGMDADYCRGVAGAVFPNSAPDQLPIDFIEIARPLNGFVLLSSGEADIMAGAPWLSRSENNNPATGDYYSFSQPYFYDDSNTR